MPQVLIIAGPNGAGKTTFANEYQSTRKRMPFINADEIERGVPVQNSEVRAARIILTKVQDHINARDSFMIETTLATRTYARKIPAWQDRAYTVTLIYLRLPSVEASIRRIQRRVENGGHYIPEAILRRRFAKSASYLEQIYKRIVDEWYVWDSNEGSFSRAEAWDKP